MTSLTNEPEPLVDPETRRAHLVRYYDAEAVDRSRRPVPAWRTAAQEEFLVRLAAGRRHRVLEIGCGPGTDGAVIAAAGHEYTGTDLAPGMVEVARRAGLDARVASATDLPFGTGSFDAVWCMSTLMHLDDTELDAALTEITRVLVPGGLFAVGMWGSSELTVGHQAEPDQVYGPPRYFHRRTDATVRERLLRHGDIETWWTRPSPGGRHHYQYAVLRTSGRAG